MGVLVYQTISCTFPPQNLDRELCTPATLQTSAREVRDPTRKSNAASVGDAAMIGVRDHPTDTSRQAFPFSRGEEKALVKKTLPTLTLSSNTSKTLVR